MENIVIVGNSAGDAGTRGWLQGVDFATGERLWRFYTVPGPGEFGHETWADEAGVAWRTGGAAIWTGGSYAAAAIQWTSRFPRRWHPCVQEVSDRAGPTWCSP
jgi:alcohol dehydrogenase (cytochrome c)